MTRLEWGVLQYLCGALSPKHPIAVELEALPEEEKEKLVSFVKNYSVFLDPKAEFLYSKGILREGIKSAAEYIKSPLFLSAAATLTSKLEDLGLVQDISPDLPEPVIDDIFINENTDYDDLITTMLMAFGWRPGQPGIEDSEILSYCRRQIARAKQKYHEKMKQADSGNNSSNA